MTRNTQPGLHPSDGAWRALTKMFFFFNDTATTEIYTLSLHDALPICVGYWHLSFGRCDWVIGSDRRRRVRARAAHRSEEHTSELQSRLHLVCRLLLEKKKAWSISCAGSAADGSPLRTPPSCSCSSGCG